MVVPAIEVFAPDELAAAAAARLSDEIVARGRSRIALAGGNTPRPIYEALAQSSRIDWSAVHLFWGDERCVPPDHASSNYRMVRETLIERLKGPIHIHRIAGELPPSDAAAAYARALGDEPLDIVLLGMGDDGHTASLFPSMADLGATGPAVIRGTAPSEPRERVTLSLATINRARLVVFVIAGAAKAPRVREVLDQIQNDAPVLPSAKVQPVSGRLLWLLDTSAAAELNPRRDRKHG